MKKIELLAPAGDMEKLKTALHFGADAVYFSGKNYSLRAFSNNFDNESIIDAVKLVHKHKKKAYVTLNVFARNDDFLGLEDYLKILVKAKVDGVIVSDLGLFMFIKEKQPSLALHVSTQANTTNEFSANAWAKLGAKRIILARELSFNEIAQITKNLPKNVETEVFVHGAMCISYSGRCLLSNYLANRDSNHGECVQACRWHYSLVEDARPDEKLEIMEDERGAYILNSKDLCLIDHIDELAKANVSSFKIEGRMKSAYYVATVVNAYKRAIDYMYECEKNRQKYVTPKHLQEELKKASHRKYTTGFTFNDNSITQNYESSSQEQESVFKAVVLDVKKNKILVEQRNKFSVFDELEILSPKTCFNKKIKVMKIEDEKGELLDTAKLVQQKLWLTVDNTFDLSAGDILRA